MFIVQVAFQNEKWYHGINNLTLPKVKDQKTSEYITNWNLHLRSWKARYDRNPCFLVKCFLVIHFFIGTCAWPISPAETHGPFFTTVTGFYSWSLILPLFQSMYLHTIHLNKPRQFCKNSSANLNPSVFYWIVWLLSMQTAA